MAKSIKAYVGDITEAKTDVIVNAANGIGTMGAGVAGAIRTAGGYEIQDNARKACLENGSPVNEGECYITKSGKLSENGVKYIYHAVTMKYPGGPTSLDIVKRAMKSIFTQAVIDGVRSLSITALGTGIGGLDKSSVARIMVNAAQNASDMFDICFVDKNSNFIKEINSVLNNEINP